MAPTPRFELRPLVADGGAPLYRQVKRELLRLIEAGACGPGESLPNESSLANGLGVSIGTLRRAVDELVHEHVLVRRQGKGTFVAQHSSERFLFQFFHIEPRTDARALDVQPRHEYPSVQCIGFARERASEQEAAELRVRAGEPVLRFENRLSLRARPVVHDRIVIAAALFRGLTEKRLVERPGTLYNLYQSDFGITVLRAHERARAVPADRASARVLGLSPGEPVLEIHRVALTFGDKPVEYRISTVNTRLHDYVSMLARPA